MIRWLVILAVVWIVFRLIESGIERLSRTKDLGGGTQEARGSLGGDELVACAGCGVHVPSSRALVRRGEAFCSVACRDGGGA